MTGSRQGAHGGSRLSPLWVSRLSPMPQSWTPAGGGGPLAGLARLSPGCAGGRRSRQLVGRRGSSRRAGAVNLAGAQRDRGVQGLGGLGVGGMGQAAAVSPVTSFQTANRRVISVR